MDPAWIGGGMILANAMVQEVEEMQLAVVVKEPMLAEEVEEEQEAQR